MDISKDIKITTDNRDQGGPQYATNQSRVAFENRLYDPTEPPKKKGLFFGKFLSAMGNFGPLGFLFPPVGIAAGAAAIGLGQVGAKANAYASRPDPVGQPIVPAYPGLNPGYSPVSMGPSAGDPLLNMVVDAKRDNESRMRNSMKNGVR